MAYWLFYPQKMPRRLWFDQYTSQTPLTMPVGKPTMLAGCLFEQHMPSTVIAHMSYDVSREVLRIHFVSGLVYEYKKVPEDVYQALKKSGSKGTFLNQHIKGNYEYKKIE